MTTEVRWKTTILAATFGAVAALGAPRVADACSCIGPTFESAVEDADAVFAGAAGARQWPAGQYASSTLIDIDTAWKGEVPSRIT